MESRSDRAPSRLVSGAVIAQHFYTVLLCLSPTRGATRCHQQHHWEETLSGSGRASSEGYLEAFLDHLKREGLSASRICQLRISARHFLAWLIREGIETEDIDDDVLRRFRRHDCRCPGMVGERRKMRSTGLRGFMTGALRLARFLEDDGLIPHPGELDKGLRLLDDFIARCATDGYARDTLTGYRSACRHILVWLHRSRIAIAAVDSAVLSRFPEHDCVCPGPFERPRKRISGSRYVYPFEAFLGFLADRGVLPNPASKPSATGFEGIAASATGRSIDMFARSVRSWRSLDGIRHATTPNGSAMSCSPASRGRRGHTPSRWRHPCARTSDSWLPAGPVRRVWWTPCPPPPPGDWIVFPDSFPPRRSTG